MRVGIIGVGMMGHGIALNIVKHGHSLTLLHHPGNQPVDDLLAAGAAKAGTPAEVAAKSDVIVLCLTGSPQVEAVIHEPSGLLEGMKPGTIIIDCSTALPASTVKVSQSIEARGGRYLDAPMTRTPKEAAQGRLNLIVGGDASLYEQCLPLMQCFAENIVHAGSTGAGHQMKLIHNFVSLGFSAVLTEAAACARQAGIAPETLVDILAAGGGGGVVLERLRPYICAGDDSGFRFSMSNALKDMNYYTAMAEHMGAPHGTAKAIRQAFELGVAARPPETTVPSLIDIYADEAARHKPEAV